MGHPSQRVQGGIKKWCKFFSQLPNFLINHQQWKFFHQWAQQNFSPEPASEQILDKQEEMQDWSKLSKQAWSFNQEQEKRRSASLRSGHCHSGQIEVQLLAEIPEVAQKRAQCVQIRHEGGSSLHQEQIQQDLRMNANDHFLTIIIPISLIPSLISISCRTQKSHADYARFRHTSSRGQSVGWCWLQVEATKEGSPRRRGGLLFWGCCWWGPRGNSCQMRRRRRRRRISGLKGFPWRWPGCSWCLQWWRS